jgi:hypothetical protein
MMQMRPGDIPVVGPFRIGGSDIREGQSAETVRMIVAEDGRPVSP